MLFPAKFFPVQALPRLRDEAPGFGLGAFAAQPAGMVLAHLMQTLVVLGARGLEDRGGYSPSSLRVLRQNPPPRQAQVFGTLCMARPLQGARGLTSPRGGPTMGP
jgi:hypothetical protein